MSLQKYKKIEDNRGFFIDDRDSDIFERDFYKSLYGDGENDVIKFVLYDVNENLLPQDDYGNERYIHSSDFGDYFRKVKPSGDNQPFEFEVNVDKLISEAGYGDGIFNVEILLINDRVGSDQETNKLWIHEISPSRTEIRVVPLKAKNQKLQSRLDRSYDALINNELFMDDIRSSIGEFLESFSTQTIEDNLISRYGSKFVDQMKSQFFNQGGFNVTMIKIVEDFKTAVSYVIDNKHSSIGSSDFGKPLSTEPPVSLDISKVVRQKLRESISYHLPNVSGMGEINTEYNTKQIPLETQNTIEKLKQRGTTIDPVEFIRPPKALRDSISSKLNSPDTLPSVEGSDSIQISPVMVPSSKTVTPFDKFRNRIRGRIGR